MTDRHGASAGCAERRGVSRGLDWALRRSGRGNGIEIGEIRPTSESGGRSEEKALREREGETWRGHGLEAKTASRDGSGKRAKEEERMSGSGEDGSQGTSGHQDRGRVDLVTAPKEAEKGRGEKDVDV